MNRVVCIRHEWLDERPCPYCEDENKAINPLTDDLLRDYVAGKYTEDLKWRGQELARELLKMRMLQDTRRY